MLYLRVLRTIKAIYNVNTIQNPQTCMLCERNWLVPVYIIQMWMACNRVLWHQDILIVISLHTELTWEITAK